MAWRHRWLALASMSIVSLIGITYVMALPDTYEVSAKVYVDTQSLLKPALRGLALETGAGAQAVHTMRRTLLVRPNLEQIARATDLDLQATTPADMERLLLDLQTDISLTQTRRENIFTIADTHEDPQLAKRVVDSVLNLFLERSLGDLRRETVLTQDFLEKQIKVYESKLEASEQRLKEFKRQNMGFLPGETDYVSKREAVVQTLRDARLLLQEAVNRRDELQRQMDDPMDPSLWMLAEENFSPLDARIQQLELRVDELLLRYTERHPDIIIARRLIADLQEQKQAELDAMTEEGVDAGDPNVTNPVYQGLKVALSSADAEVAALQVRVKEYESRLAELSRLIDENLRVEAEFARLNRDYNVLQKNYQGFVSRREQAEIGYEADQTGESMQVKVIEPTRVPVLPTGPQRNLLSMGVVIVGIVTGGVLAWFLSIINPVFLDIRQLAAGRLPSARKR
jgi:polysaccharide chain length determinant protein (PEP-CTERM system associated)